MTYTETLGRLIGRHSLTRAEARESMSQLMSGQWTAVQIAGFLTALRAKGETVDELTGAAEAMRDAAVVVTTKADVLIDTCGTGGDGQGTFNVSTAAAFVVAGAGFTVAKHGNRSVSSRSGSADVLEALGVALESDPRRIEQLLHEIGVAFLFAPAFHPAMKHALPVRKELGVRTIFNLLGPLTNPARPNVQLVGVYADAWVEPLARVLAALGCREGLVVHGEGCDEIILSGRTRVAEIEDGHVRVQEWRPEDFGVSSQTLAKVQGGDAAQNATIMRDVLSGVEGPYQQTVCLNAAAALRAASRLRSGARQQLSLKDAYQTACESLKSGKARQKLEALQKATPKAD
jgi:anthranilate phosphoribosyltransferase